MTQLARRHRNELGALHLGRIHSINKEKLGWVRAAVVDDDLAGMIVARRTVQSDDRLATIVGACVPDDARRQHFAAMLVSDFREQAEHDARTIIQATCRCDIAANRFWFAMGFTPCFVRDSFATRGRPSIIWRMHCDGEQSDLLEYRPPLRPRLSGGRYAPPPREVVQQTLWDDPTLDERRIVIIDHDPQKLLHVLESSPLTSGERVTATERLRHAWTRRTRTPET